MIAMKQDTPHDANSRFNATCLSPDELRRVTHGELPVDQFDAAIAHLDQCDECRAYAESIQSSDLSACGDPPVDELQHETACQAAMLRLMQTPASEYPASIRSFLLEDALPRDTLGPYRILGPLGSGGMSTVLLAQHERLKRRFAIKLLPRERVDHPGWLSRFEREMVAAAALEHTHVVRTTDAGHENGWHFLVMEYLDGLDVGCIARRVGPLAVSDACEIVRQAALGLAHIHAAGLVHRDIKPSNLMLTRSGTVKVLDLGLVLDGDDPICVDDRLTTVGHLMGTVAFMSPEQLADSRNVDRRADLYSLGATLFRLIAGRSPHERHGGLTKQILTITQNDAPRLDTVRDDLAEDVVRLVAEMLARDPSERPASADEIAARLETPSAGHRLKKLVGTAEKISDEAGSVWHTLPPAPAASGVPPRRRIWAWIAGGMFAAFILAAIVFKIQTDRGELVVHSDLDGLTMIIKQDDQFVEQLEISSDQDNRIVLRKGTYRVEIEGGGEALKLSDEVVTIGRGTTSEVKVTGNANRIAGTFDDDSTELYQGHDLDYWMHAIRNERDIAMVVRAMMAVQTLARNPEQELAAAEATFALTSRWGARGTVVPTSPEQVSTEQDPSHVFMGYLLSVYSRYSMDTVFKSIARGLHDCNERTLQAASLLISATYALLEKNSPSAGDKSIQEWASDSLEHQQRTELLRSIQRAMIGGSVSQKDSVEEISGAVLAIQEILSKPVVGDPLIEPYIARLMRRDIRIYCVNAFELGELGIRLATTGQHGVTWDNVINQLFLLGPIRPDADINKLFGTIAEKAPEIMLQNITRRLDGVIDASREKVSIRKTIDEVIYYGDRENLSTDEIADPSSDQWKLALDFYARNVDPHVTSLNRLKQIRTAMKEENIESWFRPPFSATSTKVISIYEPINNAIAELTARYTAVHGPLPDAETVELSSDSPSTDATDKLADPQPASPLYQGHDFAYWMQVLENERDVKAAGEAITALEVLSRGTDSRREAAVRTLELARRWGSNRITGDPETTETRTDQGRANFYMGYLVNVFPEYLPMPGLEAIDEELKNGNAKSRGVSALLLNTYRSAIADSGYVSRKHRTLAIDDIERLAKDPDTQPLLQSLVNQLGALCTVSKTGGSLGDDKTKVEMQDCGLWLELAINPDLTENDWIASFVEQRVIERSGKWSAKNDQGRQAHPNSHHQDYPTGRNQNVWGISEDELLAATRLREQGVLSAEYDAYLCASMLNKWYERYSQRSDDGVAYLAKTAADRLLEQTARALDSMKMLLVDEWSQQRGSGRGTLGEMPVGLLADENSIWKFALPFFAEHVAPDEVALELLGELKKTMTTFTSRQNDETSSIRLDAAITRLQERHDAQIADLDSPQSDPVSPATD